MVDRPAHPWRLEDSCALCRSSLPTGHSASGYVILEEERPASSEGRRIERRLCPNCWNEFFRTLE